MQLHPEDVLNLYEIRLPILTEKEQYYLVQLVKQGVLYPEENVDEHADLLERLTYYGLDTATFLILSNRGILERFARRYAYMLPSFEDAFAHAIYLAWYSLERYSPDKGKLFSSYLYDLLLKKSRNEIRQVFHKQIPVASSLNDPLGDAIEADELVDLIVDPNSINPELHFWFKERREIIEEIMRKWKDGIGKQVICLYFGFLGFKPHSLRDVATAVDITQERVKILLKKECEKMLKSLLFRELIW